MDLSFYYHSNIFICTIKKETIRRNTYIYTYIFIYWERRESERDTSSWQQRIHLSHRLLLLREYTVALRRWMARTSKPEAWFMVGGCGHLLKQNDCVSPTPPFSSTAGAANGERIQYTSMLGMIVHFRAQTCFRRAHESTIFLSFSPLLAYLPYFSVPFIVSTTFNSSLFQFGALSLT